MPELDLEPGEYREPIFQKHGLIRLAYMGGVLFFTIWFGTIVWEVLGRLIWSRLGW